MAACRSRFRWSEVACLALLPSLAHAGAWTRELGSHYARIGQDVYGALSWEAPVGGATTALGYQAHTTSLYAEVGLTPRWPLQAFVTLPVLYSDLQFTTSDAAEGSFGRATSLQPGDLRAGLQTALYRKSVQLALGVEFKVPLYRNDDVGAAQGLWKSVFPLPGDGQLDVTPQLRLGWSGGPAFGELLVGYRFRTEAFLHFDTPATFVDGVAFNLKGGVTFGQVLVMAEVDGLINVADDPYSREYVSLGPSVMVTVWKGLAVEARLSGEAWVDNAAQGMTGGIGLSWRGSPPQ
jgi:hypothetical protein